MPDMETIQEIEKQIEDALWSLETQDALESALDVYVEAEARLAELDLPEDDPAYKEKYRVLAYCLMRHGNILRQLKRPEDALELTRQELAAAHSAGNEITLARSLLSAGINFLVAGEVGEGNTFLEESRSLF